MNESARTDDRGEARGERVTEDLRLFKQAREGDFSAFEKLVLRFEKQIHRLAYRILGQSADAEDVVQQTFLTLIEKIDTFRGDAAPGTWLLRIATNHALKILRKKRGLLTFSLDVSENADQATPHPQFIAKWKETPAELAERAEVRELLDQALNELDDIYRLVFILRDIEGLSILETSDILGITVANVKVRLLRARLQLRERLTRQLGDEQHRLMPDHSHPM